MQTLIFVGLALIINFYTPEISETKKSIKNNYTENKIIRGFPYQYFKKEVLTDEMVESRIELIYIIIYITFTFYVGSMVDPTIEQTRFVSTPTSIERLIPNR